MTPVTLLAVVGAHPAASPALLDHLIDIALNHEHNGAGLNLGHAIMTNPAASTDQLLRLAGCPTHGLTYALTIDTRTGIDAATVTRVLASLTTTRSALATAILVSRFPDHDGRLALDALAAHPGTATLLAAMANSHVPTTALLPHVDVLARRARLSDATCRAITRWTSQWAATDAPAAVAWARTHVSDPRTHPRLRARLTEQLDPSHPGGGPWFEALTTTTADVLRWAGQFRGRRDRELRAWHTALTRHPHPQVASRALRYAQSGSGAATATELLLRAVLACDVADVADRARALHDLIAMRAMRTTDADAALTRFYAVADLRDLTWFAAGSAAPRALEAALRRPELDPGTFTRLATFADRNYMPEPEAIAWAWATLTHPLRTDETDAIALRRLVRAATRHQGGGAVSDPQHLAAARRLAREPFAVIGQDLPLTLVPDLLKVTGTGLRVVLDTALADLLPLVASPGQARALTSPELAVGTLGTWMTTAAAVGA